MAASYKGTRNSRSVRQLGIAARWSREAIDIERLELLPGDIEGDLSVKGRITPAGDTLRGVLDAQWKEVVVPESLAGRVLASAGAIAHRGHAGGVCSRRASSTSGRRAT